MSEIEPAVRFRQVAAATLDDVLRRYPESSTALGDHRFDDQLDDLSEEGLALTATLMERHRAVLSALDPIHLTPEDRADLAMLLGEVDMRLFEINDLAATRWDPLVYNPGEGFYPLLTRATVPLPDRLRAIAGRLNQVPERLELARRQLEAPPRVHVETAINRQTGTVAMVGEGVERLLATEPGLRPLVEPAQRRALGALEDFEGVLHALLEGPHRSPRIGPELFGRRLALALSSSLPAAEVLARAQRRVEELDEELEATARRYLAADGGSGAADGSRSRAEIVRSALDRVAAEGPDDATVVAAIEAAMVGCTEAVRDYAIVSLPDQPMRVELMPVFRRGAGGAYCDAPGPLEEGGETSFAIEPTPRDWSAAQKASFYREYNYAMVTNLTVHEAMPGHMVQLAHARRFRGSTVARQVLTSGTFVEGWAVHAERIMAEHGHGGLPVKLQQLKMQMRVAINAILDFSVHAGELTEEGAIDLMTTRGYQEQSEARGKWRRACITSSQLSTYFVGYSELAELFADLPATVSYDEVLAHGSPPPSVLRQLLLDAPSA
jgi:uncharacterized protein (DUF885 family)